jgi:hypothetical protein
MQRTALDTAAKNRAAIDDIKQRYLTGQISRAQAQIEATPVIQRINARQQEIARQYGKRGYPLTTFIGLMR